jgi:carbamoyltransferase
MIILGLNVLHGDSAACLIKDGKLMSAAEEERFTRVKHCSEFPINAINFCLSANNINIKDVDYITINTKFSYNFFNKFFFFLKNILTLSIFYNRSTQIYYKKNLAKKISSFFSAPVKAKIIFVPHHLAHVYSTFFFLEDNNNSIIFSFDGSGDFSTMETYLVKKNEIKLIKKNIFPHSLGLFYTAFTQFIGFEKYGDEYKFMGLVAYGKPIYYKELKKTIISSDPFKIDMSFFNYPKINYSNNFPQINRIYSDKLDKIFKKKYNFIEKNYNLQISKDIAASAQKIFEEIVLNKLKNLKKKYNSEKLYLTGGCSFNSLLLGKIIASNIFKNISVGPNPGDAGGAVGSAFYFCKKMKIKIDIQQPTAFCGPSFSNEEIEKKIISKILNNKNYEINFYQNFNVLSKKAAEIIKIESILFWFQDCMEWGPRALGNRSILANPMKKNIKNFINEKIKKRELFRPFAVSVLEEFSDKLFFMNKHLSPNMNIVFKTRDKIKVRCPDIVHADGTTRVQTVSEKNNIKFYNLIKDFYKITNTPMLINTSMNKESPIALSPENAWEMFCETDVKSLVLNNWLIKKSIINA